MSSPHNLDWTHNLGITATMLSPTELISGCCFRRPQRRCPGQESKVEVSKSHRLHPHLPAMGHTIKSSKPQLLQGERLWTPGVIALFSFLCVGIAGTRKVLSPFLFQRTFCTPIPLLSQPHRCQADYLLCNLGAPATGMTQTASVMTSIKYFAENRTISRIYKQALSNSAFICLLIHVSALCQHETLVFTVHTCPAELQHNKIFICLPEKQHDSHHS